LSRFSKNIAPYVKDELLKAERALQSGDASASFTHLENAHILGQESTYWHVKVHFQMMLWGVRKRDFHEIIGQVIRLIGAALLTVIKGVPIGNTGGSNVSLVKPMPIKKEHAEIIAKAKDTA